MAIKAGEREVITMRILALSDTHGQLEYINKLVRRHDVDAVLHCGDFGFMTHKNVETLPDRELSLNIKHWPHLPDEVRRRVWDLPRDEKIQIIRENRVLGSYDRYLEGEEEFEVPVYAIWGNHEDLNVVRATIENPPRNLRMVTYKGVDLLDSKIRLFGVGGNISLKYFFQPKLSGKFYPFMSFQEWCEISMRRSKRQEMWLMTHVSPGKEPILELFSLYLRPRLWLSGHMGAPFPNQYSHFTFLDDTELVQRIELHADFYRKQFRKWKKGRDEWLELKHMIDGGEWSSYKEFWDKNPDLPVSIECSKEGYRYFSSDSEVFTEQEIRQISSFEWMLNLPQIKTKAVSSNKDYVSRKPASKVKGSWFVNLPDVYTEGYSVIEIDGSERQITSYGHF